MVDMGYGERLWLFIAALLLAIQALDPYLYVSEPVSWSAVHLYQADVLGFEMEIS